MITALGVVIPARDEAAHTAACLGAVRRALQAVPPSIDRAVCVVADRCTDGTALIARRAFGGWPGGRIVVNERELSIGEVRDLGCRSVHALLAPGHSPTRTLLLSTDADTRVAPGWARAHLAQAAKGSHAVAGAAELSEPFASTPVEYRYQAVLNRARRSEGHGNVYGANLGVRADAYWAVGGFLPLRTGEDHDLWRRLGHAGYRLCYDSEARVVTSARLVGRAPHGLAELLRSLHNTELAVVRA